nr:hypothetical protein [uncultured Campylobacter sp.]
MSRALPRLPHHIARQSRVNFINFIAFIARPLFKFTPQISPLGLRGKTYLPLYALNLVAKFKISSKF